MMRCLVTGAAGFVGSHLCERLIKEGMDVIGVDSFCDYYPRSIKQNNISKLLTHPSFRFIEADILNLDLSELLKDLDYIFHQAAQAGVRASWGKNFEAYVRNNIQASQYLLEACKIWPVKAFIHASSSSVYGETRDLPMKEGGETKPISPYGVTKLAAEHLCNLYWRNFGIPIIILRYFTVYGPRQRPDMAFHKMLTATLNGDLITIYGDGEQTRDFTFISDVVEANLLAMKCGAFGETFNIGGGSRVSLKDTLKLLSQITKKDLKIRYIEPQKGDVRDTWADTSKAKKFLAFHPKIGLEEGLTKELEWLIEGEYHAY
ncbi:MAG TPA: NAD-dependent epimerase/dehydratase family protein [Syntrophaceae bacterium]|nr:NAD-dependent epimerase/dehydratase family protein [Syntrophaceae bacterium]